MRQKDSTKKSVPIVGTIRFARQLPIPVRTLCMAAPIGAGISNSTQAQASLDLYCLQSASMFDIERGCFVCDEHGGALPCDERGRPIPRDYEKVHRANPFSETWGMSEAEKFNHAITHIEAEMCQSFTAANQSATIGDFQKIKSEMWEEAGATLTAQVRLSTALVLGRVDN